MKVRKMEIVIPLSHLRVDIDYVVCYSTASKFAYILHDKDCVEPHYHIFLFFGSSFADTEDIAKWFQLGYTDKNGVEHTGEEFITKGPARLVDVFFYLLQMHPIQTYKHKYSSSDIVTNIDFLSAVRDKIYDF